MSVNDCKLTQERLKELVSYDSETGLFERLKSGNCNLRPRDKIKHNLNPKGYVVFRVDNITYVAHRLAWLYMTGSWPLGQIDHINNIKTDNRFCNLRDVSHAENMQNKHKAHKSRFGERTSEHIGVHWCSPYGNRRGRWRATIGANGFYYRLGSFQSEAEAIQAYKEAKERLHIKSPPVQGLA